MRPGKNNQKFENLIFRDSVVVLRLEKLLKSSHASAGAQNRVRVGFGIDFFDFFRSPNHENQFFEFWTVFKTAWTTSTIFKEFQAF